MAIPWPPVRTPMAAAVTNMLEGPCASRRPVSFPWNGARLRYTADSRIHTDEDPPVCCGISA